MKFNFKSLLITSLFVTLPLGLLNSAHAAADRMGGLLVDSRSAGPYLQLGVIITSKQSDENYRVVRAVGNGALTALAGLSGAFNTTTPRFNGWATCDGFYKHLNVTGDAAVAGVAPMSNNGIIMFSGIPKAPASDTFTSPEKMQAWIESNSQLSAQIVQKPTGTALKDQNPCNWVGRMGNGGIVGELDSNWIHMVIKVQSSLLTTLYDKLAVTLGTNLISQLRTTDPSKYTMISFQMQKVSLPLPLFQP